MRRTLMILGTIAVVAVLVIGISQAGGGDAEPTTSTTVELDGLAGAIEPGDVETYEERLKELRGTPVVVNAWASWCGPCKLEFPYFREAATKLEGKVEFLGLNVSDNRQEAEAFLKKQPVPYNSLEDGDARIVQKAGAAGGLPATIFYDAEGERAFIHQGGYRSAKDLEDDIERYTGG